MIDSGAFWKKEHRILGKAYRLTQVAGAAMMQAE
jgi:hypothetical protein